VKMGSTWVRPTFRGLALVALLAACSDQTGPFTSPSSAVAPSGASPTTAITPGPGAGQSGGPDGSPAAAPSATWARLEVDGDGPAPREDHTWTVAEDGRTAYLFGGRDGATVFDDLWSFDLATERWQRERVDGPPAARFGHDAAWLPGHGLVIWAGQVGTDFFDDIWLFDPAGGSWKELNVQGDKPVARYGSCSGIGPDGLLWISHGFTANGVRFDDTWTFDLEARRWTERTPASEGKGPIKRCLHACWWTSEGQFALYGGQTNGVVALGDLWLMTPGAGADPGVWTEAPDQQAPARQLAAAARRGEQTIIFGGRGIDGEPLADAWVLSDGSTDLAPLSAGDPPRARSGAAMLYDAANDRLVLFGGEGSDALGDVWELTFP
jgi:hypothetical protein